MFGFVYNGLPDLRASIRRFDASRRGKGFLLLLALKMEARTVVGRREKSLLGDPGSELLLGRDKREIIDSAKKKTIENGPIERSIGLSRFIAPVPKPTRHSI